MSKKILVVDDAMFMRKMLSDILNQGGYVVVGEGSNGKEAFEKYKELQPDLVTMDITMPEVDGISGVRMIKEAFPDAKVIMVSAMGQESMVIDSVKAGAKGFIVKPFNRDRVLEEVGKLI